MDQVDALPGERPVWCVVANVVASRPYGPGGDQVRRGLRLFAGGAKVHVVSGFGGDGWETLTVIGHHRKAGKYLTVHIRAEHLTNWRVKPVYSPAVLAAMREELGEHLGAPFSFTDDDPTGEAYRDALIAEAHRFSRFAQRLRDERLIRIAWSAALGPEGDAAAE